MTESSFPSSISYSESIEMKPKHAISLPLSPDRSGSPSRNTFDIDSPEMREFISRGKKSDGVPFTNLKIGFGMEEKNLILATKKVATNKFN